MKTTQELVFGLTGQSENISQLNLDRRTLRFVLSKQTPLVFNGVKHIQLRQNKDINMMAGYDYAKLIWDAQVAPYITDKDLKHGVYVHLPDHVISLAVSFTNALIGNVFNYKHPERIIGNIHFHSENARVQSELDSEYNDLLKRLELKQKIGE